MPDRAHKVDRKVTQWVKPGGGSRQVESESMSTKNSTTVKKSRALTGPCSASAGTFSDPFSSNWRNNNLSRSVPAGNWGHSDWIPNSNVTDPALVEEWKNAWYNPPDVPTWETPILAHAKESTKVSLTWDKIPWSLEPRPSRLVPTKLTGHTAREVSIEDWEATMNQDKNIPVKKRVHTKEIFNMNYPLIDISEG